MNAKLEEKYQTALRKLLEDALDIGAVVTSG